MRTVKNSEDMIIEARRNDQTFQLCSTDSNVKTGQRCCCRACCGKKTTKNSKKNNDLQNHFIHFVRRERLAWRPEARQRDIVGGRFGETFVRRFGRPSVRCTPKQMKKRPKKRPFVSIVEQRRPDETIIFH